eukprot:5048865-Pyramimonas_sp.AAC.1
MAPQESLVWPRSRSPRGLAPQSPTNLRPCSLVVVAVTRVTPLGPQASIYSPPPGLPRRS